MVALMLEAERTFITSKPCWGMLNSPPRESTPRFDKKTQHVHTITHPTKAKHTKQVSFDEPESITAEDVLETLNDEVIE